MAADEAADGARPWLRRYDAGTPRHLEVPDELLSDVLDRTIRRWPDRPAVIFYGRRWTYRELGEQVEHFAAALAREGVRPGDRVALVLPNCPAYPVAFFATVRLGATVVQVSPLWIGDDLEELLAATSPRAAVTLETLYPNLCGGPRGRAIPLVYVARLREFYPALQRPFVNLVLRRKGMPTAYPRDARVRPWGRSVRGPGSVPLYRSDPRTTVAVLQPTGGTTGTPKAAMLTHRNLVANTRQADAWNSARTPGEEVFAASIPLFHVYGLTVTFLLSIYEGGAMVLQLRPEARELLRLVRRYRATQLPAVPALYAALLDRPELDARALRTLKFCVSGSAPLPADVQQRFEAASGGALVEGYGITEASPVTHANPVAGERRPGSIGLPLPETEQRIVDPGTGRLLPPGEVGELEVRGPQVMLGYFQRPEETANVLHDGWLRTGDLARVDADGYAFIADRMKDVILVGGLNVYPREVEETLRRVPGVADVAVVGAPDREHGEVPRAYVVRAPGATVDGPTLIAFVREHLAHYKAPRSVEFRASLPKSGIQKTLRRALRDEAYGRTPGGAAPPSAPGATGP